MDKSKDAPLAPRNPKEDIAAFVEAARQVPAPSAGTRGRLIFALDATMSRQPTWDLAQALQAKMFQAAAGLGGLEVQLVCALVLVGDAMEENPERLAALAGELGLQGVKAFMFQEGGDPAARRTFSEIARLTGGAYSAFDAGASARLEALLRAAAAYAAGGHAALARQADADPAARLLLSQMRGS
jgi:hypothetical protein